MIENTAAQNKRIAKNTLFLYFRMILGMLVSLYTSRVVLDTLGIVDFGIHNIVGGVVAFLGFFTSSLSNVTQRYLNIGLGEHNLEKATIYFQQSITLYFFISILVLSVGETFGVWFVSHQLNIPLERHSAAFWVFQFSLLSIIISINQIAFTGAIIAHEKMSIYAYLGLLEVLFRLSIVYLLLTVKEFDRLILYAILNCTVSLLVFTYYCSYCISKFKECTIRFVWNIVLIKEMAQFVGYNLFGCFGYATGVQGCNVLLNLFFGPTVNAARGIAVQVNAAVLKFSEGITTAFKPQIIKAYASGEFGYLHALINRCTVYSYILMFLIAVPILYRADLIIGIWLKNVPDYTVIFTRLTIIDSLIGTLAVPLWLAANATGNIKRNQVVGRCFILATLPISYILLQFIEQPIIPALLMIVAQICYWLYSLYDINIQLRLNLKRYSREIVFPLMKVTVITLSICSVIQGFIGSSIWGFLLFVAITSIVTIIASYCLVINMAEKAIIKRWITSHNIFHKVI